MDEILRKLAEQEKKLDAIYKSAERTLKYFLWTLIITIALIVLPAIGLFFAVPALLKTLGSYSALGL